MGGKIHHNVVVESSREQVMFVIGHQGNIPDRVDHRPMRPVARVFDSKVSRYEETLAPVEQASEQAAGVGPMQATRVD